MLDKFRDTPPPMPPLRSFLLDGVLQFTRQASRLPGVIRIALIGSLTTPKLNPKDADVLVTVEPSLDLTHLARLGRQLKGRGQTRNSGADNFFDPPRPAIHRTHLRLARVSIRFAAVVPGSALRPAGIPQRRPAPCPT